jgi:CDGSH-type Zn-finger protein
MEGGPVLLRGELHITGPDVDECETRAALCSCGSTANAPYCDGSGTCVDWPRRRGQGPARGAATS